MCEIFLNRQLEWEDLWARVDDAGFDNLDDYYNWLQDQKESVTEYLCDEWRINNGFENTDG